MIILEINYQIKVPRQFERLFKKAAKITSQQLKINRPLAVSLVFIGPQLMMRLNKKYRQHDKVTNVLAFPEVNEILICYQRAVAEAREQGHQLDRHLAWLLVHGLLHLFGYDHQQDSQERLMRTLEFKILVKV